MTKTKKIEGGLAVEILHHGASALLPIREVTIADEELVEETFPEPSVPFVANETGAKIPDFTDRKYLREAKKCDRNRQIARVALALLDHPLAVKWRGSINVPADEGELVEAVLRMKTTMQEWQVAHLVRAIRAPREVTEEEIAKEAEKIYPTS